MIGPTWRWNLYRALVDRAGFLQPFSRRKGFKKIIFLSERDTICHAQIFPFFLYSAELADQYQIEVRELPLRRFMTGQHSYNEPVDAVFFQSWIDLSPLEMENLAKRIQSAWSSASLVYFDWFAPTDLRYAEALNPHIQAYVKKQTLRNFSNYGTATLGDTNLSDYYAKRFRIDLPKTHFKIPSGFQQKLVWGTGFEYSPNILENLNRPLDLQNRSIDLHARIATNGTKWYSEMRMNAQAATEKIECRFKIVNRGRVPRRRYFSELRNSKFCFSPFGYGEVCWRDFEAMATGALLLKPDMSHVQLVNDFFRPYDTYIPLAWDLDDLGEKIEYYIHHPLKMETISRNAFELLNKQYREKYFIRDIAQLWRLLRFN